MSSEARPTKITREQLIAVEQNSVLELVDGELTERDVSVLSGLVEGHFLFQLGQYCQTTDEALVFSGSLGCRCFPHAPDDVRKTSAIVVHRNRFTDIYFRADFLEIRPDLIVEVISARSLASALSARLAAFKSIAVPLIWIANPETRTIEIHRSDGSVTKLAASDNITGEEVLPGFCCQVGLFFLELTSGR
jgi:Uma2 family endonuclease